VTPRLRECSYGPFEANKHPKKQFHYVTPEVLTAAIMNNAIFWAVNLSISSVASFTMSVGISYSADWQDDGLITNHKGCGRKRLRHIRGYYTGICREELRQTTKSLDRDICVLAEIQREAYNLEHYRYAILLGAVQTDISFPTFREDGLCPSSASKLEIFMFIFYKYLLPVKIMTRPCQGG
jgi:hypothetical protein